MTSPELMRKQNMAILMAFLNTTGVDMCSILGLALSVGEFFVRHSKKTNTEAWPKPLKTMGFSAHSFYCV